MPLVQLRTPKTCAVCAAPALAGTRLTASRAWNNRNPQFRTQSSIQIRVTAWSSSIRHNRIGRPVHEVLISPNLPFVPDTVPPPSRRTEVHSPRGQLRWKTNAPSRNPDRVLIQGPSSGTSGPSSHSTCRPCSMSAGRMAVTPTTSTIARIPARRSPATTRIGRTRCSASKAVNRRSRTS